MANLSNSEVALRAIDGRPGFWKTIGVVDFEVFEHTVVVPEGFVTDLASVPRFLWTIIPPFGKYTAAAVVHDYLYGVQRIGDTAIERVLADRIFMEAMKELGVRRTRRWAMFRAVRMFGWAPWRNKIVMEQQA